MAHCAICGEYDGLDNKCNYCGRKHCKSHSLPENHRCVGLRSGGWEKYKEARKKRNVDHPRSPASGTSAQSNRYNSSPASKKTSHAAGTYRKKADQSAGQGSEETESGRGKDGDLGDNSPAVTTKTGNPGTTRDQDVRARDRIKRASNKFTNGGGGRFLQSSWRKASLFNLYWYPRNIVAKIIYIPVWITIGIIFDPWKVYAGWFSKQMVDIGFIFLLWFGISVFLYADINTFWDFYNLVLWPTIDDITSYV